MGRNGLSELEQAILVALRREGHRTVDELAETPEVRALELTTPRTDVAEALEMLRAYGRVACAKAGRTIVSVWSLT